MCGFEPESKYDSRVKAVVSSPSDGLRPFQCLWMRARSADRTMHASVRIAGSNPDHHLWNNNATWWCHLTHRRGDLAKSRLQLSAGPRGLSDVREIRGLVLSTLS